VSIVKGWIGSSAWTDATGKISAAIDDFTATVGDLGLVIGIELLSQSTLILRAVEKMQDKLDKVAKEGLPLD
jgi:hypothetical protein